MSENSESKRVLFTDWHYETVSEHPCGIFGKRHFGIRATGRAPNGWRMIEMIHDVSSERYIACRIAQFFNEQRLAPDMLRRPGTLIGEIERKSARTGILES